MMRALTVGLGLLASTALARADGVADIGCQGCHTSLDAVTTTLTSNTEHPSPGETVTLTVRLEGPGAVGGFYLRSGRTGTFATLDDSARLIDGEPTHA
ncbi:MAG: hypothetical protein JNK82_04965, partial [Myxococcaceae bacterium]|nr:hypothetical protein [Myxococcaceae bacterium]